MCISYKVISKWIPRNIFDDNSILVEVEARCRQATTWSNFDPDIYRHMASLSYELTDRGRDKMAANLPTVFLN